MEKAIMRIQIAPRPTNPQDHTLTPPTLRIQQNAIRESCCSNLNSKVGCVALCVFITSVAAFFGGFFTQIICSIRYKDDPPRCSEAAYKALDVLFIASICGIASGLCGICCADYPTTRLRRIPDNYQRIADQTV